MTASDGLDRFALRAGDDLSGNSVHLSSGLEAEGVNEILPLGVWVIFTHVAGLRLLRRLIEARADPPS